MDYHSSNRINDIPLEGIEIMASSVPSTGMNDTQSNDEDDHDERNQQNVEIHDQQGMRYFPYLPLAQWTRDHFNTLEDELHDLRNQFLRQDAGDWIWTETNAVSTVAPNNDTNDDGDDSKTPPSMGGGASSHLAALAAVPAGVMPPLDAKRCGSSLFHQKLNAIFKCVDVYRILSPFRYEIDQQLCKYQRQRRHQQQQQQPHSKGIHRSKRLHIDPVLLFQFG
jgi:hypothetical protein